MAYQIYTRGMACGCRGVPAGNCRIVHAGSINLSCHDLVAMQVKDELIVEIDQELRRILFRPPADEDEGMGFAPQWNKNRTTAKINCGGAIRMLGIDPKAVKGLYHLLANGRRRELVFGLDGRGLPPQAQPAPGKPRGRRPRREE